MFDREASEPVGRYVVAAKPGGSAPANWQAVVAAQPGVTGSSGSLATMQIQATASAVATLRALFEGSLRVEEVRPRSP